MSSFLKFMPIGIKIFEFLSDNHNSFFLRRLNRDLYQYDNNIPITEARVLLSVYMEIPAD